MVRPPALIAVDPGAISGAYAMFLDGWPVTVDDIAVVNGQVDAATFNHVLQDLDEDCIAVIERVGSMPKQGVASTFKFGVACGIIHGVLTANWLPVHYVTPQVWKKHFKLLGADKEASRALALRLYPALPGLHLKKHQGRAEALLMGRWYLETHKE